MFHASRLLSPPTVLLLYSSLYYYLTQHQDGEHAVYCSRFTSPLSINAYAYYDGLAGHSHLPTSDNKQDTADVRKLGQHSLRANSGHYLYASLPSEW